VKVYLPSGQDPKQSECTSQSPLNVRPWPRCQLEQGNPSLRHPRANFLHQPLLEVFVNNPESTACLLTALLEDLVPSAHWSVLGNYTFLRAPVERGLLDFEPRTRLQTTVSFLVELLPVEYVSSQGTRVDEVEALICQRPVLVGVINLEFDVWRYPGWLNRNDIAADYLGTGILVANITSLEDFESVMFGENR